MFLIYKNNYHSLMKIEQLIRKTKTIYIHVYIYCGGYFVRSIYFNETTRNNCRKKIQLRIKKQLVSLKKDEASLKTNIENLTDDDEEILKFARKEYQFSKSNETIFVLPK